MPPIEEIICSAERFAMVMAPTVYHHIVSFDHNHSINDGVTRWSVVWRSRHVHFAFAFRLVHLNTRSVSMCVTARACGITWYTDAHIWQYVARARLLTRAQSPGTFGLKMVSHLKFYAYPIIHLLTHLMSAHLVVDHVKLVGCQEPQDLGDMSYDEYNVSCVMSDLL